MAEQKLGGMKPLLLRAWRERWSDIQWSIAVKQLLHTGTSAYDRHHLPEMLLHHALVGSTPNVLMLSYLKHAVATQMVTYASTLTSIVKYEDIGKPYCIHSLLDIVEGLVPKISRQGVNEDSLILSVSVIKLLQWLLALVHRTLTKMSEDGLTSDLGSLLSKVTDILVTLVEHKQCQALCHIALQEEADLCQEIEKTISSIASLLQHSSLSSLTQKDKLQAALTQVHGLQKLNLKSEQLMDVSFHPLNVTLNALLTLEATLYPTNGIDPLVEQILIIETAQGLSRPELYCEILRTCCLILVDSTGNVDELKCAAFVFLKIPHVFQKLSQLTAELERDKEIKAGFDKLLSYVPLLDLVDTKSNSDSLQYLCKELTKHKVMSDEMFKQLMARRQEESQKPKQTEPQPAVQSNASLILRAEPTVASILKTLDADYSKNQEALLGVLCHMMSGKSFELILAAAAATGKLQSFSCKLVKFNELSKHTNGEAGKASQTRAMLFDISFIMLCHITQIYGSEQIIVSAAEFNQSFFMQWIQRCLPEDGNYKCVDMMPQADPNKIEVLLNQINVGGEIKTSLTRWHEVCNNLPAALNEVLVAWELSALSEEQVKTILDNVKGRMCCLPVVCAAWLCNYIQLLEHSARTKPLAMLHQLLQTRQPDQSALYHSERTTLASFTQTILSKLVGDLLPAEVGQRSAAHYQVPPREPAYNVLMETYRKCFQTGCVDIAALYKLEVLLNVGGPQWFSEHLVKEMLSSDRQEDLSKGLGLVLAIFNLDLETLTYCLMHHVVPNLIQLTGNRAKLLIDPGGACLAKLCVLCLAMLHKLQSVQKETVVYRPGRKRTRADIELEDEPSDMDERPSKVRKLPEDEDSFPMLGEQFNIGALMQSAENTEPSSPTYSTKEPINRALVSLFQLFSIVLSQNQASPRTSFIQSFMSNAVKMGPSVARFIVQFMPKQMLWQVSKYMMTEPSMDLLLALCDLSSSQGRRVASSLIAQNSRTRNTLPKLPLVSIHAS